MVIVDDRFRVVWIKEPLLAQAKPGVNPVGQYCFSVLFDRKTPCEGRCPVKPVLAQGRPSLVERRFVGPDGIERRREARAYPIVDGKGRVAFVARISFDVTGQERGPSGDPRIQGGSPRPPLDLNQLRLNQLPFQPAGSALTPRELEVLRLIARGESKPEIGRALGISVHTVKVHVVHIFNKLGVNDRAQAAVWAARQGLA